MIVRFDVQAATLSDIASAVHARLGPFFGDTPYKWEIGVVTRHLVNGNGDTLTWLAQIEASEGSDF